MTVAATQKPGKIKDEPMYGINYTEMQGSSKKEPPSCYYRKSKNSYADLLEVQKLHMINR